MSEPFRTYRAKGTKTALPVYTSPGATTRIHASWGEQTFVGDFYVVAEPSGSATYGAARAEFESMHVKVGPHEWRKTATVRARRAESGERVATVLANGTEETERVAPAGSWVVRQASGEQQVIDGDKFDQLYEPEPEPRWVSGVSATLNPRRRLW